METFFNVSEQTWLFLWSCVLGVGLGIVYDMFRVARVVLKHRKEAVFVEDFVFTVFSALAIFVYCTEKARGEVRFYIILGAALGFILYILTIGTLVVTITKKIVMVIWKIIYTIYRIFLFPIIKFFVKYCQKSGVAFVKTATTLKNKLKKSKKLLK